MTSPDHTARGSTAVERLEAARAFEAAAKLAGKQPPLWVSLMTKEGVATPDPATAGQGEVGSHNSQSQRAAEVDLDDERRVWRVGLVGPQTTQVGLIELLQGLDDIRVAARYATVTQLLTYASGKALDLVVLDPLRDAGVPKFRSEKDLTALRTAGVPVLVYTSGDNPSLVRRAAASAGVLGVVSKSAGISETIEAIRSAARGQLVQTTEWAAAIDGDPELAAIDLSPRLREVLALYASGQTTSSIAESLGISAEAVHDYLKRIRQKYVEAGRPTTTTDLFARGSEYGWLPEPHRHRKN